MPYCTPGQTYHPMTDVYSGFITRCDSCTMRTGESVYHHSGSYCTQDQDQINTEDSEPRTMLASDLDLDDLWRTFRYTSRAYRASEFLRYLRGIVTDPDEIDNVVFCENCGDPAWEDGMHTIGHGSVCESCWQDYQDCVSCCESFHGDDLTETLSESLVCESCRDSYYTYCDYCDGYYHDDDSYEHQHDGSGCCESPQMQFTIPNDGAEPVANDTRVTITLPAGTISPAGLTEIRDYLRRAGLYDLSYDLSELGAEWQTRDGNYAKRLSRFAYKRYQAKITPEVMSQIGCIARDHSKPVDVQIEVTRDFNQNAAYFYHDGSCYWGGYSESRCALKTNGAYGLRSFDQWGNVSGRAWIMPFRLQADPLHSPPRLVPTFRTMDADALVVFNGYGDLGGYAPARIMAHMHGWTYRKIAFSCDPMYINAGGYLVAREDIATPYTDGALNLSVRQHSDLYENESESSHA